MNHRKHGLRLSGLLLVAALGVMAFAASAQALVPSFLVAGKGASTLLAKIGATQEGVGTMTVPGLSFELNCTAFTVDEGVVETNTDGKAVLLYTGCTTLDFKTKAEIECHVVEPIKAEALLLPTELTDGKAAVLAESIKALIKLIKTGTLAVPKPCILPEDNVVTGQVCFSIPVNEAVEPLVLTEGESTKCAVKDELKYGGQVVTLKGAAKLFGTGEHNGKTIGVKLI